MARTNKPAAAAAESTFVPSVDDEVTTETASTADDMASLAYRGLPIPAGWSYNGDRGFFRNEDAADLDVVLPIDPVTPAPSEG
jgi:hypothetical protein